MVNATLSQEHHARLDDAKKVWQEHRHSGSQNLTAQQHYQKHLGEMTDVLDRHKASRSHLLNFERDIDIAKAMLREGRHPGEIPKAVRQNSINTVRMNPKTQRQYGKLVTRNAMEELKKDPSRPVPQRSKFHVQEGRQRIMTERIQQQQYVERGR